MLCGHIYGRRIKSQGSAFHFWMWACQFIIWFERVLMFLLLTHQMIVVVVVVLIVAVLTECIALEWQWKIKEEAAAAATKQNNKSIQAILKFSIRIDWGKLSEAKEKNSTHSIAWAATMNRVHTHTSQYCKVVSTKQMTNRTYYSLTISLHT